MWEFSKGALLSITINLLTVLGWWYIGIWPPSIFNVTMALMVLGFYGLEEKWAFPLGYWAVELIAIFLWLFSAGWVLSTGTGG